MTSPTPAAVTPDAIDALTDVYERVARAAEALQKLAKDAGPEDRITGKVQGVKLALSYIDEAIRFHADKPAAGATP